MKHILPLSFALVMSVSTAFGQVLIDKSIDLTGSNPADSRVMGIKQVSDAQDAVSAEALQKGGLIYASVTGGPNAYTLAFAPAISTPYSEGMTVLFKANGDNTGAVTLNGISLRKDVTTALGAGDIKDNQIITVVYDGANFQLASRTADNNSGGTVTSVSTSAANNGVTATWTNPTTTPALTIGLGAITPSSVAATGTVTGSNLSGTHTGNSSGTNTGDQDLSGLTPNSRNITINGSTQNLSADRTWNVGTVTSVGTTAANNGLTATWTNPTTTPGLTLGMGTITPTGINATGNISTTGTIGASNFSGSSSGTNTGDQTLSGLGGVPTSRTITINGTPLDLSADRTWSVGTVTSIAVTAPLTGGTITGSGTIGMPAATASVNGYLTSGNFANFNTAYTSRISSLTTTGNSGAATLASNTLNIPIYVGGSGTQNRIPKFNNAGGTTIGNSNIFDNGTLIGLFHTGPTAKLDVATGALGGTAGNTVEMFRVQGSNGNGSMLDIKQVRTSAGSDWTSAATRIQQKIDATFQGYMQFNGTGNTYGISFGTGGTTTAPGDVPERLKIASNGNVTINNLAGTGSRAVYADANGTLSTSTFSDWKLVAKDDFETTTNTGTWTGNTTTTGLVAGTFSRQQFAAGGIAGGNWVLANLSGTEDIVMKGLFDISAYPHTEVMVKFSYYFIDSWDGEWAWAGVSTGTTSAPFLIWKDDYDVDCCTPFTTSSGVGGHGAAASVFGSVFSDKQTRGEGQFKTTSNTICVMFGSNLNEGTANESYAIDNIEIYVR